MTNTAPAPSLASPCTGICKMDAASGFCLGCARSADEIAIWRTAPEPFRRAVWDALPERFTALGVTCRRLPWDTQTLREQLVQRLVSGTLVMGVVGAVGAFAASPGCGIAVEVRGDTITANTTGGAARLVIDDQARVMRFAPVDAERAPLVLAAIRDRGTPTVARGLTALGRDQAAISEASRDHLLFDLGLGRKEARFCLRSPAGPLADHLTQSEGMLLPQVMAALGPQILAVGPTRVIESALGRIEVSAPIPMPGGTSPRGPHTHLLPDQLATGRALPAGFDLPRAYLPGAMLYPAPDLI